jgi:hypothetical protein
MNELIEQLALDAGLLNYVDHETPRRYFVHGHADLEEVEKFARIIVFECIKLAVFKGDKETAKAIKEHFGIEQ